MVFLSAAEPCTLNVYGASFYLEPIISREVNVGHILVMEGELGRRILQKKRKEIQRIRFNAQALPGFPMPLQTLDQVIPGSKIIVIRGGGIGDVLMLTPAIRELRRRLPEDVHLSLATFKSNRLFFDRNPYLDSVIAQPVTLGELMEADYYVEFKDPASLMVRIPMIDYYLQGLGLDPQKISDKSLVLNAEPFFDRKVAALLDRAGSSFRHMVYLNGLASDQLRDLSPELLRILPAGFPDILFVMPAIYAARHRDHGVEILDTHNILWLDTEESLHRYVTALTRCDAVVTADTSGYHIAAALNKPCVALFGPISSRLRTTYYPTVLALDAEYQGKLCQSPCGKSILSEFKSGQVDAEQRCPEALAKGSHFSPCLASFSSEKLIHAFEEILKAIR